VSRRLIEKIQGKSCGGGSNKGLTKGGMLDRGGRGIFDDFPSDEEGRKRKIAETKANEGK